MRITLNDQIRPLELIRRIAEFPGDVVELVVEDKTIYTRHPGNLDFLEKAAQDLGKRVKILAEGLENQPGDDELTPAVLPDPERAEDGSPLPTGVTLKVNKPSVDEDFAPPMPVHIASNEISDSGKKTSFPADNSVKPKRRIGFFPKKILIGFLILLLISAGAASAYVYYYLPQAEVTLYVAERVLERNIDAVADQGIEAVSSEEKKIPGHVISVEIQETENATATGNETVGEQAQGVIEIRNFGSNAVKLRAGTQLTESFSKLNYTTLDEVIVPRATETSPDPKTKVFEAGTVDVSVMSEDIGDKYNLAAESDFSVADYDVDDIIGVNNLPLTGGLTKEITIVTQEDQNLAQEQLKVRLFASAATRLKTELMDGYEFSEDTITNAVNFANFSEEIGSEAEAFTVTLKADSSVITYNKDDLTALVQQDIEDNIPDGFELSEENIIVKVEDAEQLTDKTLTLKAKISALVVPVLDVNLVRDNLISKRPADAEEYLRNIEEIEGYDMRLWPTLPDIVRTFPHVPERLEIKVKIKDRGE